MATSHLQPLTVEELTKHFLVFLHGVYRHFRDPPNPLKQLRAMADDEQGWIKVLTTITEIIPLDDPLGLTAISIIFYRSPLPATRTIPKLTQQLKLSIERANNLNETNIGQERNICMVMGCIGERYAGPKSVEILTEDVLDYLFTFIVKASDPIVAMFALIALEKFAKTKENKTRIENRLNAETENPILNLLNFPNCDQYIRKQMELYVNWILDNLFIIEGRPLSYQTTDMSSINVILNTGKVSGHLKMLPNGLEVRNNSIKCGSVHCTFKINTGCWYYEATVLTSGIMHIGWATNRNHCCDYGNYAFGDDPYSISYDGSRQLVWYKGIPTVLLDIPKWEPGDVIGCLLDIEKKEVIFYLNGVELGSFTDIFAYVSYGLYAAATLMEFQQCQFNFGHEPFKFPPSDRYFNILNEWGVLTKEQKIVTPRKLDLSQLQPSSASEDLCIICCDNTACTILDPCKHRGFCGSCAPAVNECPLCRALISNIEMETNNQAESSEGLQMIQE